MALRLVTQWMLKNTKIPWGWLKFQIWLMMIIIIISTQVDNWAECRRPRMLCFVCVFLEQPRIQSLVLGPAWVDVAPGAKRALCRTSVVSTNITAIHHLTKTAELSILLGQQGNLLARKPSSSTAVPLIQQLLCQFQMSVEWPLPQLFSSHQAEGLQTLEQTFLWFFNLIYLNKLFT